MSSNPYSIVDYGFGRNDFNVGVSSGSGKIAYAYAVGVNWKETYLTISIVFASKKYKNVFCSINFKIGIRHWFVVGAVAVVAVVPSLAPIASTVVKAFASTAKAAPMLISAMPVLLKV